MISLDNNLAERTIRGPVVTRKNAGGSHNGQTARNAAEIWTVTTTAQMAALNLLTYLTAYLDECGRNGGKPLSGKALERFLPWKASPEDRRAWGPAAPARIRTRTVTPSPAPLTTTATSATGMPSHSTSEYLPFLQLNCNPRT